MALNDIDKMAERQRRQKLEQDHYTRKYGEKANELLSRMEDWKKRQGGVTPIQLQEVAYEWSQVIGIAKGNLDELYQLMYIMTSALTQVQQGKMDLREWSATVLLTLMPYAVKEAFDLYEVTYEQFTTSMESMSIALERLEQGRA